MSKIGYARVSTEKQSLDRQIHKLKEYGCEEIFTDKATGSDFKNRKGFNKMLNFIRKGDIVVFVELDRLGRDKEEIKKTWEYFISKEIDIVVLDMPILDTTKYNDEFGELILSITKEILAHNAESERIKTLERQRYGIEQARKEGRYKGRGLTYSATSRNKEKRQIYFLVIEYLKQKKPIKQISDELGISRQTVYRIKKEKEEENDL